MNKKTSELTKARITVANKITKAFRELKKKSDKELPFGDVK